MYINIKGWDHVNLYKWRPKNNRTSIERVLDVLHLSFLKIKFRWLIHATEGDVYRGLSPVQFQCPTSRRQMLGEIRNMTSWWLWYKLLPTICKMTDEIYKIQNAFPFNLGAIFCAFTFGLCLYKRTSNSCAFLYCQ